MKLTDLYNFYDGILPDGQVYQYCKNEDDYIKAVAHSAERQFIRHIKSLKNSICLMVSIGATSEHVIQRYVDQIKQHRNNAIKARKIRGIC